MRIAICLNGLVVGKEGYDTWVKSRNYLKDEIIDFYNNSPSDNHHQEYQVDVFAHTWEKDDFEEEEFKEVYQPKAYLIEPQKQFDEEVEQIMTPAPEYTRWATFSWRYSSFKSVELKRNYEKEHNFVYDVVLLCRYDQGFRFPWHKDSFEFNPWFDMNYVYCEYWWGMNEGPGDIYFYSNSKNIDIIADQYNHLVEYLKFGSEFEKALYNDWPLSNPDAPASKEIFRPKEKRSKQTTRCEYKTKKSNHAIMKWHMMKYNIYEKIRPVGKYSTNRRSEY